MQFTINHSHKFPQLNYTPNISTRISNKIEWDKFFMAKITQLSKLLMNQM
jgi:hypothetical protein